LTSPAKGVSFEQFFAVVLDEFGSCGEVLAVSVAPLVGKPDLRAEAFVGEVGRFLVKNADAEDIRFWLVVVGSTSFAGAWMAA